MIPGVIANFDVGAAVAGNRIVKLSADATVVQASAATDALIGVSDPNGAASGERLDVTLTGMAEIVLGGTVTRGALITADANGKGVAAAPSSGANNRVVGVALVSGVSGDVIDVLLSQGSVQG
jgi:hypothetical protein